MTIENQALTALDKLIHPSFGMSLLALDMVRAVRVCKSELEVDLVMNCPGCPRAEVALASARKALYALEGAYSVKLVLVPETWIPPWARQ